MACNITFVDVTWNAQDIRKVLGSYTVEYYNTDTMQKYSCTGMMMHPQRLENIEQFVRDNESERLGTKYYGKITMDPKALMSFNLENDDDTYPIETMYEDTYDRFSMVNTDRLEFSVRGDFYQNELYLGENYTKSSMETLQRIEFQEPEKEAENAPRAERRRASARTPYVDFWKESQEYQKAQSAARWKKIHERNKLYAERNTRRDPISGERLPNVFGVREQGEWINRCPLREFPKYVRGAEPTMNFDEIREKVRQDNLQLAEELGVDPSEFEFG